MRTICSFCSDGRAHGRPCRDCDGRGFRQAWRTMDVDISAGILDDTTLRFAGAVPPRGPGDEPGDLSLIVHVAEPTLPSRWDRACAWFRRLFGRPG